jgi:hypothetical protein
VFFREVKVSVAIFRSSVEKEGKSRYQLQSPKGAATEGKSECVSGQRLNANDFRMILAEDDTEKAGGYQEKIKMEREAIRRGTILDDAEDAWRLPISRCIVTANHL